MRGAPRWNLRRDARRTRRRAESEVAACTAAASSARSVAAEHARAAADASAALASATTRAESAEREAEAAAHGRRGEFKNWDDEGAAPPRQSRISRERIRGGARTRGGSRRVRGASRDGGAVSRRASRGGGGEHRGGGGGGGGAPPPEARARGDAGEGRDAAGVRGGDARYVSVHARSRDRFRGDARRAGVRGDAGPVGGGGGAHGGWRLVADLEKREQRYMAMFKKQIWNFREAVYLIFGYKVDMGEDKATGMPTATLRSKFAAREDELITIRAEPAKVGATGAAGGGKADLHPTPYAETPEVKLMVDTSVGRCRSVPAFVANLTMELFNKQTLEREGEG